MSGGDSGGQALQQEQQQLKAQQELLIEKQKKLEEKRIAGLRAKFTTGGLQAPGVSATAPATLGGSTTAPLKPVTDFFQPGG